MDNLINQRIGSRELRFDGQQLGQRILVFALDALLCAAGRRSA
ncbi:MAG: hypothetical protein R2911_10245 [Caldilineaceae bacterium]